MNVYSRASLLCAAILTIAAPGLAIEQPKSFQDPVVPEEMMLSLGEVARAFGPHAVIFQAALLNEAVRNGSILEAKVEAPAYVQRDGKKYVSFTLESGIVFNDKDVTADGRALRTWKEIVAAAIRRMPEIDLKGEGLAVNVGYHHRTYATERELREEIQEVTGRGQPEKMTFFLLIEDANGIAKGALDSDTVLTRTTVLRGEEPVKLE